MGIGSNIWCSAYPAHSAFIASCRRACPRESQSRPSTLSVVAGPFWGHWAWREGKTGILGCIKLTDLLWSQVGAQLALESLDQSWAGSCMRLFPALVLPRTKLAFAGSKKVQVIKQEEHILLAHSGFLRLQSLAKPTQKVSLLF